MQKNAKVIIPRSLQELQEDKCYQKVELVFIIDADFPYDTENYHSIISYIGYIEGAYTGYRKDYTGFR